MDPRDVIDMTPRRRHTLDRRFAEIKEDHRGDTCLTCRRAGPAYWDEVIFRQAQYLRRWRVDWDPTIRF